MKKVPKHIINKLQNCSNYTQKAEKLRIEIEEWFKKQGIDTDVDSGDLRGGIIADIIIDTEMEGNINEAVYLIEKQLNNPIERKI